MTTKADLETLADMRLDEATLLLNAGRYSAAYYLAGYAVELGIKVCIAGLFRANVIPDKRFVDSVYSHDLEDLIGLAGIKNQLQNDMRRDTLLSLYWRVAMRWTETSRYAIWDRPAAASIIEAVGHQVHGVLQWLKKHW